MTTTKLPTNCTVCGKRLNSKNRASVVVGTLTDTYNDLCVSCYEADPEDTDELINNSTTPAVTGRKNFNHANCSHPRTPKGRAACRAAMAAGNVPTPAPVVEVLPTGTVGSGKSVHLMMVMGEMTATVCNPKRVLDTGSTLAPMSDVTCKSCIKLS